MQEEIYAAIDAGKLRYRPAAMHGTPWLRLFRGEVKNLVVTRSGGRYLRERKARTELAQINRELSGSPPGRKRGRRSWPTSSARAITGGPGQRAPVTSGPGARWPPYRACPPYRGRPLSCQTTGDSSLRTPSCRGFPCQCRPGSCRLGIGALDLAGSAADMHSCR
jgi:hypothetical protein